MPRTWIAAVMLVIACSDDRRVPYTQRDEVPAPEPEPAQTAAPAEGRTLPAGTREVAIEGAPLRSEAELRAVLPLDLDDDGDRDVVGVTTTPDAVQLVYARRQREHFELQRLASLPTEGCAVEDAHLASPSPEHIVAQATLRCEGSRVWQATWVLSREGPPRVLETLSRRQGSFSLSFGDLDEDGHADLRAITTVGDAPFELHFLDRPSGLARTQDEPRAFLDAMRERDPVRGIQAARELCAGEEAGVRVGSGAWGLPCPAELTGELATAGVVAAVREGALLRAIDAIGDRALTPPLREALNAAARPGVVMERVAPFAGTPGPATAHVALRFDGEDLIVRGALAERYGPDAEGLPADAAGAPVSDPSGALFVQGVVQTCAGLEVTLLPSEELGPGVGFAAGRQVPVPIEATEDCRTNPIETTWRVLGWAPQGLLLAHPAPSARLVVPLTADGHPAGAPVPLADDAPSPAPLRGARTTPSGDVWILETPHGVLRVTPAGAELWRPQGWPEHRPLAAALSEDGTKVAVILDGAVSLLRVTEASRPPDSPP